MFAQAVVEQLLAHAKLYGLTLHWCIGVRPGARIHPYDGQELEFPTQLWTHADASDTNEALLAMHRLLRLGFQPVDRVPAGKQVYVCAEWQPKK